MAGSARPRTIRGYEVLHTLGRGGMSVVYKARHPDGRVVAIKVASQMVMDDVVLSKRFVREHSVAAGLEHPNLIRVYEHGVQPAHEAGDAGDDVFLVMELIEGVNLHEILRRSGPMSLEQARPIFRQLCDVLAYLHGNNIIHRDIKPANLIIDKDGTVKLADLGLLKSDSCPDNLTRSRVGLGTVDFASPEQFDDAKHVDTRADLYSLAATLYVTISGKHPFGAGGAMEVLSRKLAYQFIPLSEALPDVPPAIDRLVNRCLHPDPANRPSSVEEFRKVFEGATGDAAGGESLADLVLNAAGDAARLGDTIAEARELRPTPPTLEIGGSDVPLRLPRFAVDVPIQFEPMGRISSLPGVATIVNISQGGMCLKFGRYTSSGTILKVWLPSETPDEQEPLLVRVAWNKSLPSSTYHAGCAFLKPLEGRQLERMLHLESGQTSQFEAPTERAGPERH